MFGSIYLGLSGLNAYQRGLQQVSNNVSNLNTTGFKSSTVTFQDLFGTPQHGGMGLAGGDASGNGVTLGEIQLDFKQGELRQTGRELDLAVNGTGFLVVTKGDEMLYLRTGSFEIDKEGYVVLAGTEYRLATLDEANKPVNVSIDAWRTSLPTPTTKIVFADNLSSTATTHGISDVKVYAKDGTQHVWSLKFDKNTTLGGDNWDITITDAKAKEVGKVALKFISGVVDPATAKIAVKDATAGIDLTLDFSGAVQSYSSGTVSTLRSASVDGYGVGAITSIKVNADGKLEIGYSNQQKRDLGAVAIADFRDPQALERRGGGLYAQGAAGPRALVASGDQRAGKVESGKLEASNVDLSKQFGELILIQRGFQASSQIISVSNDMIQQLFGIRGQ
ncbi:flagellar hook-basal body complex protein [Sphingomonas gilva]|uniref:Flagellar hook protein FlgE n=1 Tax=Sphingomonas gilva TaxID=2305907 RepID=A0A396RSB1_9SPHN|nr:flagellar hook-basal body complex protein [Sphingomonas gilva]RHW18956.1 flagellar hook-basal body complex protein [Sphingomonas gilva]